MEENKDSKSNSYTDCCRKRKNKKQKWTKNKRFKCESDNSQRKYKSIVPETAPCTRNNLDQSCLRKDHDKQNCSKLSIKNDKRKSEFHSKKSEKTFKESYHSELEGKSRGVVTRRKKSDLQEDKAEYLHTREAAKSRHHKDKSVSTGNGEYRLGRKNKCDADSCKLTTKQNKRIKMKKQNNYAMADEFRKVTKTSEQKNGDNAIPNEFILPNCSKTKEKQQREKQQKKQLQQEKQQGSNRKQKFKYSEFKSDNNNKKAAPVSTKGLDTTQNGKSKPTSAPEDEECLLLPGFYYDKEKKKYFKIQPNHSNISSTVTRETIQKKEKEEKRINDLAALARRTHTVLVTPRKQNFNLPHLLCSQSRGDISGVKIDNSFLYGRISNLEPPNPVKYMEIFREPISYERLEHMLQIDVNSEQDKILGLWSVKDSLVQRIQLLNVSEKLRTSDKNPLSVSISTTGRTVIQSLNKVTNICWADVPGESRCRNILYTLMCHTGDHYSLARIRSLDIEREAQNTYFDFNLGLKAVWTCAWNGHAKQFSVGSEKCSLVIDAGTRRLWELYTNKSDTLSQVFSQQSSACLYSGTRGGQIFTHDLRSISTRPVSALSMSSSVCCLKLLQDNVTLLASDVKGGISLWDTRMRKELVHYTGCHNDYRRIPVHTDESERLVYGAGQDGYIHFWCLQTGKLLRSIPPPVVTDIYSIPAVKYSERWGNRQGNAGLLMGLGSKIYLYPSFMPG